MGFPFVIRKLNKILRHEQIIAARGADRFAPTRIQELTQAIEILKVHQVASRAGPVATETSKVKTVTLKLKDFINQIPLFK